MSTPADHAGVPAVQPWSPYPVQDWSALPIDPMGAPPVDPDLVDPTSVDPTSVDPTWAPPTDPRRWWVPLVVLAVLGSLLGVGAYAGSATTPTSLAAAAGYLPVDGSAIYQRVETTRELRTDVKVEVTENALLQGPSGLLSTDATFGGLILGEVADESSTIQLLRTTTGLVNDTVATPQTTRVYRVNDDITLLGESSADAAYLYSPALLELPADVTDGQSWTSAGSAGPKLDYASRFRAQTAPGDCLAVTGQIRYTNKAGAQSRVDGVTRTWCRGRGLVATDRSFADVRIRATEVAAPEPESVSTADAPISWADPKTWTAKTMSTVSIDPTLGQGPMLGTTAPLAPVRTTSGLVLRTLYSPGDLVATTPKTSQEWTSVWRVHPGGTILTTTGFGNVVVVTTTLRQVVAYSDTGVRLWQRELDELAPAAPVRISDTAMVLVDLSGQARRLELGTGTQTWVHDVGADVNLAPVAGSGVVVVMDRGGTTTALELDSGRERWHLSLLGKGAVVLGDTVSVLQDQTVHGVRIADGSRRWLRPVVGNVTAMVGLGDRVVVATKDSTVLIGADGMVRQRLAPYLMLTLTADHVVGWGTGTAEVFDRAGTVLAQRPIPAITVVYEARPAVVLPDGVLLANQDWTFEEWSSR
ncbi:MAG TPA: PQQ-binding-like beta-propeller repeat protein [Propionibacteriaceae bacterium]